MARIYQRGSLLVEVVIASAIILSGILALNISFNEYIKFALANQKNVQAAYLIEEGLEAATMLRDNGWTTYVQPLSTSTMYYFSWNATTSLWTTTTTPQYIDSEFLRSVTFGQVYRDGSNKLANSGTADQNTRLVTVTVSYFQGHATSTKSISTYITNL